MFLKRRRRRKTSFVFRKFWLKHKFENSITHTKILENKSMKRWRSLNNKICVPIHSKKNFFSISFFFVYRVRLATLLKTADQIVLSTRFSPPPVRHHPKSARYHFFLLSSSLSHHYKMLEKVFRKFSREREKTFNRIHLSIVYNTSYLFFFYFIFSIVIT